MIGWSCIRKRPKDKDRASSFFSSCAPSKFSKSCSHDIYCDEVFYDFPALRGVGEMPPASPQIAMKILPAPEDTKRRSDYLLMLESQMRVLHPNNPSDYVSVELPRRKSENDACAVRRTAKQNILRSQSAVHNKNNTKSCTRKSFSLSSAKSRSDSHNSNSNSKNRSDSHNSTNNKHHLNVPERNISINRTSSNTYREKNDNENAVRDQRDNVPAIVVEFA